MTASLANRIGKGISALRRPRFFDVAAALLIAAILVQLVRLFWTVVTPVAPVGNWQPKVPQAMDVQSQKSLFSSFDPFFGQSEQGGDGGKITGLSLTLFGIRSTGATGAGSAIIADSDGEQRSYLVGEEITQGVTLHSVEFDHVVISNNGALEKLFLDQSVPAETVGEEAAAASNTAQDNDTGEAEQADIQLNPQSLANSISLTPRQEGGQTTGLVVGAKDDGAMLNAAGLKQGDIIVKLNERNVSAPADLVTQIRPGARLSLQVERNGEVVPIAIILEN